MKKAVIWAAIAAGICTAQDQVEIGGDELPSNKPFCGDCAESMRYQVLYLEDELDGAMEISAVYLKAYDTSNTVTLDTLVICMGQYDGNELGTVFADNYIPGTLDTLFKEADCTLTSPGADQWFEVPLDVGYWYDGTDGLVVEFAWSAGEDAIYNWNWITDTARQLLAGWRVPSGSLGMDVPHILLEGALSFEAATFGQIKSSASR